MTPFLAELIGTALLIVFGNGVVANVILQKTKGHGSGWIVITFGWAMGVFVAVYSMGQYSGAHINPAVTVSLAVAGMFDWAMVPLFLAAQLMGAFLGSVIVWLAYRDHFAATDDAGVILACHATGPEIRSYGSNFVTEVVGTVVLMLGIFYLAAPGFLDTDGKLLTSIIIDGKEVGFGLGALSALPVALLVFGIGLSLGGPTGYAINPARDLGPRLAHAVLPIAHKGASDWAYGWVPIFAPLTGAVIAALLFLGLS